MPGKSPGLLVTLKQIVALKKKSPFTMITETVLVFLGMLLKLLWKQQPGGKPMILEDRSDCSEFGLGINVHVFKLGF